MRSAVPRDLWGEAQPDVDAIFSLPVLWRPRPLASVAILAILLALVLSLTGPGWSWAHFGVVALLVLWAALGSALVLGLARRRIASLGAMAGGCLAWLLVSAFIFLCAVAAELAVADGLGAWVGGLARSGGAPAPDLDWGRVLRNGAAGTIVAGLVLRYLYIQQRLRAREQSALRLRLQALQSRIRPHFLFNSMNIIASLIETDPEAAETVVEDLAELFRASLNAVGNQVPLQVELDLCDRYLRIERLRLGRRLRVEWDADPVPHDVCIPLLTLQPLLENAIYHGVQPRADGGTVHVRLRLSPERVDFTLSNPLPPAADGAEGTRQGNRLAVANIRSRLEVLFGADASLRGEVEPDPEGSGEGDRFVTRLSYPRVEGNGHASEAARAHGSRRPA